jgi:hypothetical protein
MNGIRLRNIATSLFSLSLLAITPSVKSQSYQTLAEASGFRHSADYIEIIRWWKEIAAKEKQVAMFTKGPTDSEHPLNLIIVSRDGEFDLSRARTQNKRIILINNGIHAGEPDGIDASMILVRDLLRMKTIPSNVVLAIIPVYNIGGCLNRSSFYRVDQNGPEEKGSRGNALNLDLNRDFIKMDSREAQSFAKIFHEVKPDILIDNHVSNGADYQYVMTLISTQHNKLGGPMGEFLNTRLEPAIIRSMSEKKIPVTPYVNVFGSVPDSGWVQFLEISRFSSGYAALWNTFSFMPETHMLKDYRSRVTATVELMKSFIEFTSNNSSEIASARKKQIEYVAQSDSLALQWKVDSTRHSILTFLGFEGSNRKSNISGQPRLYYDRNKPFTKQVKFYNYYSPSVKVKKPVAYIVPAAWQQIISRLRTNNVQMRKFTNDTSIVVQQYHIESFSSLPSPFEGHYLHSNVQVSHRTDTMQFKKGDYFIPVNQQASRFLVEVLEPQAPDSYFAWNFFDAILQRKEDFSAYVFEETAEKILRSNPALKQKLDAKAQNDSAFAKDGEAQLEFIYANTPYQEPRYRQYPIFRVIN